MNLKKILKTTLKNTLIGSFILLGLSCSHPQVQSPSSGIPSVSENSSLEVPPKLDQPRAVNPETTTKLPTGNWFAPGFVSPGAGNEAVAAFALAGALMGSSKVFTKSEPETDLSGSCQYGDPETPAVSPCSSVTVNLLNKDHQISASAHTNRQGQFRFYVPLGHSYTVQVIDRKGRSASTQAMLGRSNYVALYLKP